jgi:hypothetical protein
VFRIIPRREKITRSRRKAERSLSRSEPDYSQARNAAEIPKIAGPDRVAELESTGADNEISQREYDAGE